MLMDFGPQAVGSPMSRTMPTLPGLVSALIGGGLMGGVGYTHGSNIALGALAGALLVGALGHGLASGKTSPATLSAVLFALFFGMIGPGCDDYAGNAVIPASLFGAGLGWLFFKRRQSVVPNEGEGIMVVANEPGEGSDPHQLIRFLEAQASDYEVALSEIKDGVKRSHWMWYIFPQLAGLGFSATSVRYAIKGVDEARAYLDHPVLGPRLVACAEAALGVEGRTAIEIFGSPDDMKLKSSATLFAHVSPEGSVFHRLIDKYYQGERDSKTLGLLGVAT